MLFKKKWVVYMPKIKFKIVFKHFALYAAVSFLIIFLLSYSVLFALERVERQVKLDETKAHEVSTVNLGQDLIGREFLAVVSDLNFLVKVYKDSLEDETNYKKVENDWAEFSRQQGTYNHISFIDTNGDEKIRINYFSGIAITAQKIFLQSAKDNDYFYNAINLPEGSIYVTSLELYVEDGKVQVPYIPLLTYSSPVYSDSGELLGVLALNYSAKQFLNNFRETANHSYGKMVLLDEEGYWLSSPDITQLWNFMFPLRVEETFAKLYPDEWEDILAGTDQILGEKGLFTFTSVDIGKKLQSVYKQELDEGDIYLGGGNWYIVSTVLRSEAYENYFTDNLIVLMKDVFVGNIWFFILVFSLSLLTGLLAFLYMRAYNRTKYYSQYDALTDVYNRRTGTDRLDEILLAKNRQNFKISVCFLDVNGLKEVNDILGHKAGDELLVTVANIIKSQIRGEDFVARMGGDEFLLVFSRIGADEAEAAWGRITQAIDRLNTEENRPYIVSVSHGIVACSGGEGTCSTTDKMIKAADEKMYVEKRVVKTNFFAVREENEKD